MNGDDLDQSLDAHSQFVPIQPMGESLIAISEKIFFQNASTINRQQLEKDKQHLAAVGQQSTEEQSHNQFLEVSKWKKNKESTMHQEMVNVKKQVDEIITQTRWRKKQAAHKAQQVLVKVADETWVPHQKGQQQDQEEIEDQTQQQQQEEEDQQQEQEEQEEQEQQDQQEEEQQESEEQSEQDEDEEGEEQEQEQEQEEGKQKQEVAHKVKQTPKHQHHCETSHMTTKSPANISKVSKSNVSYDDKTDTQSEMKRTEYLPTKWNKKAEGESKKQETWKRKEAILLRIAMMVQ